MLESAIVAFATFFATIGPIDVAATFVAMTTGATPRFRRIMAIRGTAVAALILICFALAGEKILRGFGISLSALKISGGILLLLIGIEMVFARTSGGTSTTHEEIDEAFGKQDISVVPLAIPLIAGPGTMGAAILLMANAKGSYLSELVVIGMLVATLLLTLSLLLVAPRVQKFFGVTGMHVVSRIFGVLLTALAVQFMIDGLAQSGLFRLAAS